MKYLRGFVRFWIDFIIGDDWRVALGVAVAIGVAALFVSGHVPAWWVLPVAVAALLYVSLRRETRASERR